MIGSILLYKGIFTMMKNTMLIRNNITLNSRVGMLLNEFHLLLSVVKRNSCFVRAILVYDLVIKDGQLLSMVNVHAL